MLDALSHPLRALVSSSGVAVHDTKRLSCQMHRMYIEIAKQCCFFFRQNRMQHSIRRPSVTQLRGWVCFFFASDLVLRAVHSTFLFNPDTGRRTRESKVIPHIVACNYLDDFWPSAGENMLMMLQSFSLLF